MILLVWVVIKLVILFGWTGIRRVTAEAVKKPSPCRESGVELLLYNIMKGSSSRFHSKAERVLQLLTSETIHSIGHDQGKLVL
jgi:U3 small nucleolar RNA-associated protein 20